MTDDTEPEPPTLDDDELTADERTLVLAYVGAILDAHEKNADAFGRANGLSVIDRADDFQNTAEAVGERNDHALDLLHTVHSAEIVDVLLANGPDDTADILRGLDAGTFWFETGKKMRAIHHYVHEIQHSGWDINDGRGSSP